MDSNLLMAQTIQIPLLHDHHTHPLLYASLGSAVNLEPVRDKVQAIELLQQRADEMDGKQASDQVDLILALGWRSNQFQFSQSDLESLPALAVFNLSLHQLLVNASGRELLRERYGDDVDHIEDPHWYELNFRRVLNWFANLHATPENLIAFYRHLESIGIFSAEELLLVDEDEINLFETAGLSDRTKFWAAPDLYDQLSPDAKTAVSGLKLFTDGAIGARTAALSRPYLDEPDNHGMLVYEDRALRETIDSCLDRTPSLAIHAIGDRAISQIIETLRDLSRERAVDGVRIEHAQLLYRDMAAAAKDLGLTLSMQPNFSNDSIHYRDRLHPSDCQQNNPFRMLIDEIGFRPGGDLIFGSDGMPHGAANALQQSLVTALPHQRLALEELIEGYGGDDSKGTIELDLELPETR
ncbi:MAG: amidohydrolase family protein [Planctomycetota bacterium]